jgi:hypothetical protein
MTQTVKSRCILTPKYTIAAGILWLLLPACGLVWMLSVVGPDPHLLYLAGVVLFPVGTVLLAPWIRAWLDVRKSRRLFPQKLQNSGQQSQ